MASEEQNQLKVEFTAYKKRVSSVSLASGDVEYELVLRGSDGNVLNLAALDLGVELKVTVEVLE